VREPPSVVSEEQAASTRTRVGLRVALTAAFLTGHPVRVPIGDYPELQRALARRLAANEGGTWSLDTGHAERDPTYDSGGGFASTLPLIIARREGARMLVRTQAALDARPDDEQAWLANATRGWALQLESVRVDVYDLGMAVLNATLAVELPAETALDAAARTVKRLAWLRPEPESGGRSPLGAALQEIADETVAQFSDAVAAEAPNALQDAWLAHFVKSLPRDQADRWGRLLWLHPVHLFAGGDAKDDPGAAAMALAPPFHRVLEIPDGLFLPGIGWSAIVTERAGSATTPLSLTELHWAYYALYMEIDRGMLAVLDDHWSGEESLAELEREADRVFGDYLRLMEARARLDSALATLGGDEFAIWQAIAEVQKFASLVDAVERKIDVLQRVAERRVQQAAASRERRTSAILSGLTALTVVTVTIALLGNFLGSRSDALGHLELRVAIVAAAFAATIGLYREAFRERRRRRSARDAADQRRSHV